MVSFSTMLPIPMHAQSQNPPRKKRCALDGCDLIIGGVVYENVRLESFRMVDGDGNVLMEWTR